MLVEECFIENTENRMSTDKRLGKLQYIWTIDNYVVIKNYTEN